MTSNWKKLSIHSKDLPSFGYECDDQFLNTPRRSRSTRQSARQRVSYGQAAQAQRAGRGAARTDVPQLAYKATSSVCRGRLNAFVQALDQKVEDIAVAQGSGGP